LNPHRLAAALSAPALMLLASLLFALMGVAVKSASAVYTAGEIVMYRSAVGTIVMAVLLRARGVSLRTPVPLMHFWRSAIGVAALLLWFYSIAGLPLATAVTLNYMSSVWMAVFVIGGGVMLGRAQVDGALVGAVLLGFAGVAMVLRPTIDQQQLWYGLMGLLSGVLAALAYLQVSALGRVGEPEDRVVLYFSAGGVLAGAAVVPWAGGLHAHSWRGLALLLAIGVLATLAQLMITRAYAVGRPLANAALQYLGIAFAFGFGVWLFDDPVTWQAIGGMLLIVAAGLAATVLCNRSQPIVPHPTDS
jgi:S-adenosylmethionine uptake transporter